MYLRDYLHDLPLKHLKRIAAHLGISVEYQARIKLMNAIDRAFWDGALTPRLIRNLSENGRRMLSLVAFSYESGARQSHLVRKMEKLSGIHRAEVDDLLEELTLSAFIGGVQAAEAVYFSPRGIVEEARKLLASEIITAPESGQPVPSAAFPCLMEDIFSFLAAAYREPISLTLKGSIKRNVLDRIFTDSPTGNEDPEHFSPEDRDTFVTEYLIGRGLLRFERRDAVVTPSLDGWLGLSMTARTQDVIAFALRHYLGESQAVVPFQGLITETPSGFSIHPENLAQFLHTGTLAAGTVARLQVRVWQMLSVLGYMGLLLYRGGQFIMTETGERFFHGERLSIDNSITGYFTLQPNFEALIGPELDPRVRFTLELMSQRKSRDIILTSVVSRGGVALARERGMSTRDVLTFFERHSRTLLPQNVRFSLENWAKAYGSIHFEPALLMRFRDPATCEGVMHIPEIAPYIRERLSETVLTISPDRMQVVAGLLRKSGYLPEITGESTPDPARSGEPFIPITIQTLLSEESMPEPNRNFVFPEEKIDPPTAEIYVGETES